MRTTRHNTLKKSQKHHFVLFYSHFCHRIVMWRGGGDPAGAACAIGCIAAFRYPDPVAAGGAAVRWGGFQNVIHVMSTRIQAGLRRMAAALLMLSLMALIAVGQAADPLRARGDARLLRTGQRAGHRARWRAGDFRPLVRPRRCRRHARRFLMIFPLSQTTTACPPPPLQHHGKAPAST